MRILQIGFDCYGTDELYGAGHEWAGVDLFGELKRSDAHGYAKETKRLYDNVQDALDGFRPELVLLGVDNLSKNPVDVECAVMERNIPLVISKLRLRWMTDYDTLYRTAEKSAAPVWIGEFYRLNACTYTAGQLLRQGIIGAVEQVVYQCFLQDSTVHPWMRVYPELALEDLAFHHFSVLHQLVGLDGEVVYASSRTPRKSLPATGTVSNTSICLASGAVIDHCIHWMSSIRNTDFYGSLSIDGTEGGLLIENGGVMLRRWGEKARTAQNVLPPYTSVPACAVDFLSGKTNLEPTHLTAFEPVMRTLRMALKIAGCMRESSHVDSPLSAQNITN